MMNEQNDRDRQFQIECLTHDLIAMLMSDDGLSMEQAMAVVYGSNTFKKVERADTGLFYQGAVYVMDMLRSELAGHNSFHNKS